MDLASQKPQVNPKELNPYLKNGEGWCREEISLVSPSHVVGDGGLSWRLKALKRAKEQAEREGHKLDQVFEERWGLLGEMTASVMAGRTADAYAHLHAIKDRKRNSNEARLEKYGLHGDNVGLQAPAKKVCNEDREYLQGVGVQDPRMKAPKVDDSLLWKGSRSGFGHLMRPEDTEIIHEAAACLNKFDNDGSFLNNFNKQAEDSSPQFGQKCESTKLIDAIDEEGVLRDASNVSMPTTTVKNMSFEGKTANQLAAKALQLRLQGKCKEADELVNQAQIAKRVEVYHLEDPQGKRNTRAKQLASRNNGPSLKSIVGDYERHVRNNDIDVGMADSECVSKHSFNHTQYQRTFSNF